MSNPRKHSVATRDVSIVREQSLAGDSFDESDLCTYLCHTRVRDKFCLETAPKTVFVFYFYVENQLDLCHPQRACLWEIKLTLAASCTFFPK